MKNELEFLKNQVVNNQNISQEEKKRILSEIYNGKTSGFNSGYATIDQPWMKHYPNSKVQEELEENENKTVWDFIEKSLEKHADIPLMEYFNNAIC